MRKARKLRPFGALATFAAAAALMAPTSTTPAAAQQAQAKSSSDIVVAQNYRTPPARAGQARMAPYQVRQTLQRAGYRRVADIRYVRVGPRQDFYRATAWMKGRQYRLRVSDETGRIIARTFVQARYNPAYPQARVRGVDRIEVRQSLIRQGYSRITNIRFNGEVHDDHFVAEAWKNGRHYRLKIDDDNGRILARTRIR